MPASNATESRSVWWLGVFTLLLRILLWPLRRVALILFPPREFDGLSPAVTAKASQQFVGELSQLVPTLQHDVFCTSGFSSLKTQASENNSLMLVYLHSPLHRLADSTRQKLLLDESVLEFLLNHQDSLTAMGVSIHTAQGAHLAQLLGTAAYPMVCLLQPSGTSSLQLIFKAEGPLLQNMTATRFLSYLNTAVQRHQSVRAEAEARRIQREQEAELRREQDLEFQETLRADQERQRIQQEERERELERVQQQEDELKRVQQAKLDKLQAARDLLREEPTSGGTRVRFVLPTGSKIDRRFESDETIGSLKAFLILHFEEQQVGIETIGLSTNYPKRSYENDNDMSLEEAGLSPQSVLMVQDLDA